MWVLYIWLIHLKNVHLNNDFQNLLICWSKKKIWNSSKKIKEENNSHSARIFNMQITNNRIYTAGNVFLTKRRPTTKASHIFVATAVQKNVQPNLKESSYYLTCTGRRKHSKNRLPKVIQNVWQQKEKNKPHTKTTTKWTTTNKKPTKTPTHLSRSQEFQVITFPKLTQQHHLKYLLTATKTI